MRHIRLGIVQVATLGLLLGLTTVHVFQRGSNGPCAAAGSCAPAAGGTCSLPPHGGRETLPAISHQGEPTLAPPRECVALPDGRETDRSPRGRVLYVTVATGEAEPER